MAPSSRPVSLAAMAFVLTEISDGAALVTLNDPDRRNVVTDDLNAELIDAVDMLEADPSVSAMVLTGAAPAFSSGGHLDELLAEDTAEGMRNIYRGFLRVANSSLATIAAVNGAAVGAGMNLALACDVILAGESAKFDSRFLQIAIHPGGGHTWRLRHATNMQVAKAMVLFGEVLDGPAAERVGLAYRCVPDDQLIATALGMASHAAKAPKELISRTKDSLANGVAITVADESVDLELEPQLWSMTQPAFNDFVTNLKARIASKK